jgi:nitrate/nitrite-specific signal transduction histidine kinase
MDEQRRWLLRRLAGRHARAGTQPARRRPAVRHRSQAAHRQLHIDPAPRGPGPTDQIEFLDRLRATIAAHAGAQRVAVWLENADDGLRMRVTDDGVGFLPWIADTGPGPSQLGLVSMREQAAIAGGTCQVVSAPGMGTTVELWLPLSSIG